MTMKGTTVGVIQLYNKTKKKKNDILFRVCECTGDACDIQYINIILNIVSILLKLMILILIRSIML